MWLGGSISRVAGTGIASGIFLVVFGLSPTQAVVAFIKSPPDWIINPWFKISLLVLGITLVGASLHFNIWSSKQQAIDDIAEELSWAIHSLLNSPISSPEQLESWDESFRSWCDRVSIMLGNRAFFTRADQLHFDRIGFVRPANFGGSYDAHHEWLVSQLQMKFERLRDVINWTQMRRR